MDRVRKYPIGIQTFSEIIRSGYVYVDKTDLVWQLAHYAKYVFLSRPRRFGKSLLSSTLNSYFSGNRELFEGLKMIELEQEWTKYPVLHFDLSSAKHMPPQMVKKELGLMLSQMEALYGSNHDEETLGMRLSGLIDRAYEQTGKQVVVIIDEYNAPLLDFYEYTMYLIFSMLNVYARTKVKCAGGRVDMVVWMPDSIYVIELKVNDTAENALKQIDDKGYAIPYQADGRRVVKVGVSVDADTRTIKDWNVAY